jgi:hypothetical protein
MQISAANLMASQQAAKPHPQQTKQAAPFEPLTFRQSAPAAGETAPAAPAGYVRPGTNVDIRI